MNHNFLPLYKDFDHYMPPLTVLEKEIKMYITETFRYENADYCFNFALDWFYLLLPDMIIEIAIQVLVK